MVSPSGMAKKALGAQRQTPRALLEAQRGQQRRQGGGHRALSVDLLQAQAFDPAAPDVLDESGQGRLQTGVISRDEGLQRAATALEVDDRIPAGEDDVGTRSE